MPIINKGFKTGDICYYIIDGKKHYCRVITKTEYLKHERKLPNYFYEDEEIVLVCEFEKIDETDSGYGFVSGDIFKGNEAEQILYGQVRTSRRR